MKIAYIQPEYISLLDFESPSCLTDNSDDNKINGERNMQLAILENPNTCFYTIEEFINAFNDSEISCEGILVLCTDDKILIEKL